MHWWASQCSSICCESARLESHWGRIALIIEEMVDANQAVLSEVLDHLGNKDTSRAVPESLCCELREKLRSMLGLGHEVPAPGPGGLFPGLFEGLTLAGNTRPRRPRPRMVARCRSPWHHRQHSTWGVFQTVSPQCVGRETDRLRYLNAKVWDAENYSSYHEHKEKADKVLQTEIDKGYVQWAPSRDELEREVGTLQLAKMAVVVKGEKVRFIHDMRRNGTNSKVTFSKGWSCPC